MHPPEYASPRHGTRTTRRLGWGAVLAVLLAVLLAVPASADLLLDQARAERGRLTERIQQRRKDLREAERMLRDAREDARRHLARLEQRPRQRLHPRRFRVIMNSLERRYGERLETLRDRARNRRRALTSLERRREAVLRSIDLMMPLKVCPIRAPVRISDDFGVARYEDGKFHHWHQGNDMGTYYGAPIVAPFDGVAVGGYGGLGGAWVKVYGDRGYAYNAHLSRFGSLGRVSQGTVIGYVGTTGNATSPHNHFEWHPGGGSAVDPHIYLLRACFR